MGAAARIPHPRPRRRLRSHVRRTPGQTRHRQRSDTGPGSSGKRHRRARRALNSHGVSGPHDRHQPATPACSPRRVSQLLQQRPATPEPRSPKPAAAKPESPRSRGPAAGVGRPPPRLCPGGLRCGWSISPLQHDILANETHGVALVRQTAERNGKKLDGDAVHVVHYDGAGLITESWFIPVDAAAGDDFWS